MSKKCHDSPPRAVLSKIADIMLKLVDFTNYQVHLKVNFHKALLPFYKSETVHWYVLETFGFTC